MSKQKVMKILTEDDNALNKARKLVKIGQIVSYQDKKLEKIKGGWKEVSTEAYANLVIIQV